MEAEAFGVVEGVVRFDEGVFRSCCEIDEARRQFIKSFGSCSFEEPVEDLRALGLMPVEGAAS